MSYSRVSRRRKRLWPGLAAVCALLLLSRPLAAQPLLSQNLVRPGETTPIDVHADQITTWLDGSQRVFLLQGKVSLTQGDNMIQMPRGVVWVDEQRQGGALTYALDVYGEGGLQSQQAQPLETDAGFIRLATMGQVNIKAYGGAVKQQSGSFDPVFQRAVSNRPPAAAAGTVQQAAGMGDPNVPAPIVLTQGVQATPTQLPRTAPTTGPADALTVPPRPGIPRAVEVPNKTEDEEPATLSTPRPFPAGPPPVDGEPRQLSIRPRSGPDFNYRNYTLPTGETAVVFTNGVILRVTAPRKAPAKKQEATAAGTPVMPTSIIMDIEADRLVFWTKENSQQLIDQMKSTQGQTSRALEFFLSGNVEMRIRSENLDQTLRAEQVYYDVGRNVAVALKGDLEIQQQSMPYPVHLKADELLRINEKLFQANRAVVYSTQLPSDPGLTIEVREMQVEEIDKPKRGFLGFPVKDPETGQPAIDRGHYFRGKWVFTKIERVPVFFFPYLTGRVEDPLGPLENFNFGYNRIFGTQIYTTWDIYQLLGLQPLPGTRWRLFADYMSLRGPALGQEFDYNTQEIFGTPAKVESFLKMYGIHDTGIPVLFDPNVFVKDILGGSLGYLLPVNPTTFIPFNHPEWRGRVLGDMNVQELPYGFSFQGQVAAISDRNFMPQYYLNEYLTGYNTDSFAYLKQQQNQWAWTLLADGYIGQQWVTRTNWFPRADGWLLSQDILGLLTYNVHASAGYAQLRPADLPPPVFTTDRPVNTGRLDLWQDISLPLTLGAFKVVPYLQADLAYYSQGIQGNNGNPLGAGAAYADPLGPGFLGQAVPGSDLGRAYGGAGVRAALPLSRLFPDVQSDLFNVDGIYHKITLTGNYYYGRTNTSMFNLPQLDRLNDDTTDRTLRDIYPYQFQLNPANAAFLTTSPVFNPQVYALQRLLFNRTDTLDNIDVLQLGLRQRWQTKRGFPGSEHVVDWMTLDLRASLFPEYRQAFLTNTVGILEYDWVWNVGDRTALTSNGWMEPVDGGPRYFSINSLFNRPDGTNLLLGYRQIDPLLSRAILASITYPFSAKYAFTASTAWDFGAKNQTYSILLSRFGSDLIMNAGISFNSILSNFSVTFELYPSLLRNQFRSLGTSAGGNNPGSSNTSGPGGSGLMGGSSR